MADSLTSVIIRGIHADMCAGVLSWDIQSCRDVAAAGINLSSYVEVTVLTSATDIERQLRRVDRWLEQRVRLGSDDVLSYHLTDINGSILTADNDTGDTLRITINQQAEIGWGDIVLTGSGVDHLITGLARWRADHPNR